MKFKAALTPLLAMLLMGFNTEYLGPVDLYYDFETIETPSGPDTFQLFEMGDIDVSISSNYAYRGAYSLRLTDTSSSNDFPEFQGYFPEVESGEVRIGFAFMTPVPSEKFNIAFAGQGHFKLNQNGMGLWLFNDKGVLRHVSNSIPKRLITLRAYEWYWVEIITDVTAGRYSISIRNEAGDLLVERQNQAHPSNRAGSSINMYSFAGDLSDKSDPELYIDEFSLSTQFAKSPEPFIAPGRRALFVDMWDKYYRRIQKADTCLAPSLPNDFLSIYNVDGRSVILNNTEEFAALLNKPTSSFLAAYNSDEKVLQGVHSWALGCQAMQDQRWEAAADHFLNARSLLGNTPAPLMGHALASARLGQRYVAQSAIYEGAQNWPEDVRWPIISAIVAFTYAQYEEAENVLEPLQTMLRRRLPQSKALLKKAGWLSYSSKGMLRREFEWSKKFEPLIVAEQYYFSLLWQRRYDEATNYASRIGSILSRHQLYSPVWIEREGDAALFDRNLGTAEAKYKRILSSHKHRISTRQKLSDVYFLRGDNEQERNMREAIYGSLNYN